MNEQDVIILFPIKNQEFITQPKSLIFNSLVFVINFKYRQFSGKNEKKFPNKEKSTITKVNLSQNNFCKLASIEKKDKVITILNLTKFLGYSYLSSIKHLRKGQIQKHRYNIQHIAEIKQDKKTKHQ